MVFPCVGQGPAEWSLSRAKLAEYAESYPGLDVLAEIRKALQWVRDNPTKRKTHGGMPKFLGGWLSRANDRGASRPTAPAMLSRAAANDAHIEAMIREALV
jgi:hypothetical protein